MRNLEWNGDTDSLGGSGLKFKGQRKHLTWNDQQSCSTYVKYYIYLWTNFLSAKYAIPSAISAAIWYSSISAGGPSEHSSSASYKYYLFKRTLD